MNYESIPWLNYAVVTMLRIRGLILWLAILCVVGWIYTAVLVTIGEKMAKTGKIDSFKEDDASVIRSGGSKMCRSAIKLFIVRFLLPTPSVLKEIAEWIAGRL